MEIEPARPEDGQAILELLAANGLPAAGLLDHLDTAVVVRQGNHVIGCAALEVYDDGVLLRSVAVDVSRRGAGLGVGLTRLVLDLARRRGAPAAYLLTTTAEPFFSRLGFSRIARDEVPAGVRESVEFRSACPASATVMRARL